MKLLILILILINITTAFSKENSSQCSKCNVIIIAMDALQAKHVHHLGYKVKTTPTVDALAKSGVSFSQAISPSSWTVPTYLSIFTSTYPSVHGLTNRYEEFNEKKKTLNNFKTKNPTLITLAEFLKSQGYKTGAFTGDAGISAVLGYDKGFDTFFDKVQFGGLNISSEKAIEWIKTVKNEKFFVFLHGYDQHGQFPIDEKYMSRFWDKSQVSRFKGTRKEQEDLREKSLKGDKLGLSEQDKNFWRTWYDGKIRDADDRLAQFLSTIQKLGLDKNTIFILLSDHGTEFFEHEGIDHGHTLYDELIHVPLIFKSPKIKNTGRIIDSQVSTMDVLPTLISQLVLIPTPGLKQQMQGRDLSPVIEGKKLPPRDVFSETDYRNFTHKRSIRTSDGWKYIMTLETGSDELYNLNNDPKEMVNLTNKEKKKAEILRTKLQEHLEKDLQSNSTNKATNCLPVYKGQCEK